MRLIVSLVVAAGVAFPSLAAAAERPLVRIDAAADLAPEDAARLTSAIVSQVADVADVVATADTKALVVRLEKAGQDVTVTLADGAGRPLGKPRVVTGEGEVAASTAGAIVRAYLVASTSETRAAEPPLTRPSAPPAPAPPDGPRRDAPSSPPTLAPHLAAGTVRFGAYYTGTTVAPELPWQNGVRLEGSVRASRLVYGGLSYAFCPGVTLSRSGVDVRVTRHFVGAFVGLESTGSTFAAGVDVGAGVDVTLRATTNLRSDFVPTAGTTHPSPVLALRAHGRLRAPEVTGLSLDVAPTFEASPGGRAMVLGDLAATPLLTPSEARFRLDVGGTFDGF